MRVLLDESIPRQLADLLTDHFVSTVQRRGWAGTKNGELLRRASDSFDAFVTADQSLPHQQRVSDHSLRIVVLAARDNRIETVTELAADVLEALAAIRPGEIAIVRARREP